MKTVSVAVIVLVFAATLDLQLVNAQGNRPPINPQDSTALVALYNATGGSNWTDTNTYCPGSRCWLENGTWARNWFGVFFEDDLSDRVSEIRLPQNNMTGTLPNEIGNLEKLVRLTLWGNAISGEVPETISKLGILEELDLGGNQFARIPDGLYELPFLKVLSLADNRLDGTLPTRMVELPNLETLYLSGNAFEGSIPAEYTEFSGLKGLFLGNNNLSGEIPSTLGKLDQLEWLDLANNDLEGEISKLKGQFPPKLKFLNLQNNRFSGSLYVFRYSSEDLTGGLPEDLERLDLSGNQLTGGVPSRLSRLFHVKLHNNRISSVERLDLTQHPAAGLQSLTLFFNELVFDGINRGWSWMRPEYSDAYVYDPQSEISGLCPVRVATEGDMLTFHDDVMARPPWSITIDRQWLRNGMPVDGETGGVMEIGPIRQEDHRTDFAVRATSPSVEGLTLQSTPSRLLVLESKFVQQNHAVVTAVDPQCAGVWRAGSIVVPLRKGDVLFPNDVVLTSCRVEAVVGGLGTITIGNDLSERLTTFRMTEKVERDLILSAVKGFLEKGEVSVADPKTGGNKITSDAPRHTIETSNARVMASGAHFFVSRDSTSGITKIVVSEGTTSVVFDTLTTTSMFESTAADSVVLSAWQTVTVTDEGIQGIEDFAITQLEVSTDTVTILVDGDWRFGAYGSITGDDRIAVAASWTAGGGVIGDDGYFVAGPVPGSYTVIAVEPHSGLEATATVNVQARISTQVEAGPGTSHYAIGKIHPNPFRSSTRVPFSVDVAGEVRLMVHDVLGRKVSTLFKELVAPGQYEVTWDGRAAHGSALSSGVYLLVLDAPSGRRTSSAIIVR